MTVRNAVRMTPPLYRFCLATRVRHLPSPHRTRALLPGLCLRPAPFVSSICTCVPIFLSVYYIVIVKFSKKIPWKSEWIDAASVDFFPMIFTWVSSEPPVNMQLIYCWNSCILLATVPRWALSVIVGRDVLVAQMRQVFEKKLYWYKPQNWYTEYMYTTNFNYQTGCSWIHSKSDSWAMAASSGVQYWLVHCKMLRRKV